MDGNVDENVFETPIVNVVASERERECFRDIQQNRRAGTLDFLPTDTDGNEEGEAESLDSVSEIGELGADEDGSTDDNDKEGNDEGFLTVEDEVEDRADVRRRLNCFIFRKKNKHQ